MEAPFNISVTFNMEVLEKHLLQSVATELQKRLDHSVKEATLRHIDQAVSINVAALFKNDALKNELDAIAGAVIGGAQSEINTAIKKKVRSTLKRKFEYLTPDRFEGV